MSRTFKTRPHWVKLNDPKYPTRERHQHFAVKREKIGEEMYIHTPEIVERDEYGKVIRRVPEYGWMRPVFRTWVEEVPCTIDIPEMSWREERHLRMKGEVEKLCDKVQLYRQACPCCTRTYAKKLSARAQRATINQQLHNAVRDFGHSADPDDWYDVDINHMSVNEDWKWWD